MFEVSVETTFAAAHAITIAGQRETVHGHNWHVTVTLAGETLDRDGLLVDFHAVEGLLAEIIAPFRNADLNQTPPFDRLNPTAENVARHIAESLDRRAREWNWGGLRAESSLKTPPGAADPGDERVRILSARVTEAPGCAVVYRIDRAGARTP